MVKAARALSLSSQQNDVNHLQLLQNALSDTDWYVASREYVDSTVPCMRDILYRELGKNCESYIYARFIKESSDYYIVEKDNPTNYYACPLIELYPYLATIVDNTVKWEQQKETISFYYVQPTSSVILITYSYEQPLKVFTGFCGTEYLYAAPDRTAVYRQCLNCQSIFRLNQSRIQYLLRKGKALPNLCTKCLKDEVTK